MTKHRKKPDIDRATVLLVSGELDKALIAFEIAIGAAAMGSRVEMWFAIYGVNCLRKPRGWLSPKRWFPTRRATGGTGHNPDTDVAAQYPLIALSPYGAGQIPLSRLNFMGIGPLIVNHIFRRKGIATLDRLIHYAEELGVHFKICQICIDAMAIDVEEDLVVSAEVLGVSSYTMDIKASHYNVVV